MLTVFKTNTSYGRWDEARKAWGLVVNHARNIARMGSAWVTEDVEPDPEKRLAALERLSLMIWTFPRSLQRHLLGEAEDHEAYCEIVRKRLPPDVAEGLIIARHKPSRALYELSNAINDLPMPYLRRIELDKSCVEFANAMGACDRIFTSPVPLVYTRHTARFLGGWILGMPLGLWASFGNVRGVIVSIILRFTLIYVFVMYFNPDFVLFHVVSAQTWNHVGLVPIAAIISFFFFGIEQLAIQLEEPFSILPLQNMTDGMGLSANEHLAWHFEPTNIIETIQSSVGGTTSMSEIIPTMESITSSHRYIGRVPTIGTTTNNSNNPAASLDQEYVVTRDNNNKARVPLLGDMTIERR